MKRLCTIALALGAILWISSCDVINPAEDIPAYLHIEPFVFELSPGQGTGNQKITEGWVYVNGDYLGAYTLPATLPVLVDGVNEILVDPGIKDNGIASTPDIYPYFDRYGVSVDFAPEEIDTIRPTTSYANNANFQFIENFESNQHFFKEDLDDDDATGIELTNIDAFEGSNSALIRVSRDNPLATVGSIRISDFSAFGGTPVYIEMNYKADVPIGLGWISYDRFGVRMNSLIDRGVNSNAGWNKIYFNFTEIINEIRLSGADNYQLVIRVALPIDDGDFTMDEADVTAG